MGETVKWVLVVFEERFELEVVCDLWRGFYISK
jgi:hypothetical protein